MSSTVDISGARFMNFNQALALKSRDFSIEETGQVFQNVTSAFYQQFSSVCCLQEFNAWWEVSTGETGNRSGSIYLPRISFRCLGYLHISRYLESKQTVLDNLEESADFTSFKRVEGSKNFYGYFHDCSMDEPGVRALRGSNLVDLSDEIRYDLKHLCDGNEVAAEVGDYSNSPETVRIPVDFLDELRILLYIAGQDPSAMLRIY